MHLEIRDFEPDDAKKMSQLITRNIRQVLIQDYSNEAVEALLPSFTPEELIEDSLEQFTVVGLFGNELVGTAALRTGRVRTVFVDVARHKCGIGKKLMAAIEAEALNQGLKKVYLFAGLSACGFYEKIGYTSVKRVDRELHGAPVPVIEMEKVPATD